MKKYLILILMVFSTSAFAGFKNLDEATKKLAAYKVADIDGDAKRLANKEKLKIDEMFDDLEAAVKLFEVTPLTAEAAYEMERVCLITFLHDPSTFAADLILPAYDKNKDLFEKAAKKLHPYDQQIFLQTLQGKSNFNKDNAG